MSDLEKYFEPFREKIIGNDATFESPYGTKRIIYADWIASGRLYEPIEKKLLNQFGPFVANTHTETTLTGTLMTRAYKQSHKLIKEHVNAGPNDVNHHSRLWNDRSDQQAHENPQPEGLRGSQ